MIRRHMPSPDLLSRRSFRNALLALLMLLTFAPTIDGAATMDYARDIFIALRLLHGEEFPLAGPLLNGASIHLGPVWYYVLAALLGVTAGSWFATTLLVGLLGALQIPFAYLAGKALHDRRTGLMWAALLVVPGWITFNFQMPSHPTLAPMLMLAFLVCALRYARHARSRHLLGMALAFTLAVHAHPSALALAWIGLGLCLRSLARRELRIGPLALAALIALAPLLPALWWDAMHGFSDLGNANTWLARTGFLDNLSQTGPMVFASMAGGLRYWLDTMLDWPAPLPAVALAWAAILAAVALLGLASRLRDPATRAVTAAALAAVAAGMATIAAMRELTPFYMAAPVYVLGSGALALGLGGSRASNGSRGWRLAQALTCGGALVLAAGADIGIARFQQRGAWPFGWWPLIDVRQAPSAHAPMLWMPAYAMATSGRFLCSQPAPSVHGVYATHALLNYAIDMRLSCGRSDVVVNGADTDRQHWLGLSRATLAKLGIEPHQRLGPLGVLEATPVSAGEPIAQHATPVYPPYWAPPPQEQERRLSVTLRPGEYLAVNNTVLSAAQDYRLDVSRNGQPIAAVAEDWVSRVYACADCDETGATLEFVLRSANLSSFDLVTFRAPRARKR